MSSVAFETQRAALADVVAIPVTPFAEDGSVARTSTSPTWRASPRPGR
ncbi:hypothetical protein AB0D62_08185 [Streptomyces massasporeus]